MKILYVCNDSIMGLFSAIYDAWMATVREKKECGIRFTGQIDMELFCEYIVIVENEDKVKAVERLILNHMGWFTYKMIYHAALSTDKGKGDAILQAMLYARTLDNSRRVMDCLSEPCVEMVCRLAKNVSGEAHEWTGFLRFQELSSKILYAKFAPKNRVLTCVAPHFSDRLFHENWLIYDETYGEFAVHEAGKNWVLASGVQIDEERLKELSLREQEIQQLWVEFRETIAIKERRNPKCQLQHMPLWYRKNMVEFAD